MGNFSPWEALPDREAESDSWVEVTTRGRSTGDDCEGDSNCVEISRGIHIAGRKYALAKPQPIWKVDPKAVTPTGLVALITKLATDAIPGNLREGAVSKLLARNGQFSIRVSTIEVKPLAFRCRVFQVVYPSHGQARSRMPLRTLTTFGGRSFMQPRE